MFCNQCEQTSKGKACTRLGICGKNEAVAIQQDKLVWQLRELAAVALMARDAGIVDTATDDFAFKALFSTLTNVNFDPVSLRAVQEECLERTTALAARVPGAPAPTPLAALDLRETAIDRLSDDEDVRSAMQILLYGLKGVAAYADHAAELGQRDPDVAAFLYRGLRAGTELDPESHDLNGWLGLVLECGKANLRAMELLEAGNTGTFGTPVPTPVSLGRRKGKAILISGHDLPDLLALLEQTRDTGINVYTHGEMLPAHAYPLLHAFPHLAGHYGTAWQNQQKELPAFPGAVLFTTNCIQDPKDYADKVFTSGNVSWPGLVHCKGRDFSAVIRKALELPGFVEDVPGKEVLTGFGRECRARRAGCRGPGQAAPHLPGRRLRRRPSRPQLLHRTGGEDPGRLPDPDPGLRQVPLLRQGAGQPGRHPAPAGRGPVQRRLRRRACGPGPGRCPEVRRQ